MLESFALKTRKILELDYNNLTTEFQSFRSQWLQTKYPNHVPVKLFTATNKTGRFFIPKYCKQIEVLGRYDLYNRKIPSNFWSGITDMCLYELYMHKHLVRKSGTKTLVFRNLYFEEEFAGIAFDCSGEVPNLLAYQGSSGELTRLLTKQLKNFNTSKMTPDNIRTVLGKTFDAYIHKEKK